MNDTSGGKSASAESSRSHELGIETALDRLAISKSRSSTSRQPSPATGARRTSSVSLADSSQPSSPRRRVSNFATDNSTALSPRLKHKSSSSTLSPKPQIRRATSNSSLKSLHTNEPIEPSPRPTANSIAKEHFQKELQLHSNARHELSVFIHDSCYGHRWARPKTSKSSLSLIVERPERLRASALGISSAYVRAGGHHAGGVHAPSPLRSPSDDVASRTKPSCQLPAAQTHALITLQLPFCIRRSTRQTPLSAAVVTAVHGTKWMQELQIMCDSVESRLANGEKELTRPETPSGSSKPYLHEGDLYLCKDSLEAMQGALGGVLDAVDTVFSQSSKRAFVCIRPPGHHCSADLPSGFCWLNNVHVGIEHAAQAYGLTHAAIIDFDLHHGDGSQTITWERNTKAAKAAKNAALHKKTTTGYFSLHDINSYPCEWGDLTKVTAASVCMENSHNQTIWNVHLQPWKTEDEFWSLYETRYKVLIEKARNYLRQQTERFKSLPNVRPKAAIFVSAGFDASEWEGQGMQRHKVNVPTAFYSRFTRDIRKLAEEEGTSVDGRIISVLEGGYSDRALTSGVLSHLSGLMSSTELPAEASWWTASALAELEATHLPPAPATSAPKRPRNTDTPTYQTPTQSFTAKVVDPTKIYRTTSGTLQTPPRSPTPPAPEIDWQTAAYEFGKLLIPSDRTTTSCRYEELNETKAAKQERHSTIGVVRPESAMSQPKRELRTRKAKMPTYPEQSEPESDQVKISKTHRRRTTGDAMSLSIDIDNVQTSSETASAGTTAAPSSAVSAQSSASNVPARATASRASSRRVSTGGAAARAAEIDKDIPAVPSIPTKTSDVDDLSVNFRKIKLDLKKPPSNSANAAVPSSTKSMPKKNPASVAAMPKPKQSIPAKPAADKSLAAQQSSMNQASRDQQAKAEVKSTPAIDSVSKIALEPSEKSMKIGNGTTNASQSVMHGSSEHPTTKPVGEQKASDGTAQARSPNAMQSITSTASEAAPAASPDAGPSAPDAAKAPNGKQEETSFIPFIPPSAPSAPIQQAPLTWLPPNTNTPVQTPAKRTKDDLPMFSPVGKIPFAGPRHSSSSAPSESSVGEDRSVAPSADGASVHTAGKDVKSQNSI